MPNNPLVFISCGQSTPEEKQLGHDIVSLIKSETTYDAYFAEEHSSLVGLAENVLDQLKHAAAFIGIMHRREELIKPNGETVTRASVWVEEEVAIAAFVQRSH